MKFQYNDGGRKAAGYTGETGECVTRAIAIATGLPYQRIYDRLNEIVKRNPQLCGKGKSSSRTGIAKKLLRRVLAENGWVWTPTMQIGSGCTVHLRADELPSGRLIVSVSKHVVAVIDGVVHDTHDCSRDETRCVYGYWHKPTTS